MNRTQHDVDSIGSDDEEIEEEFDCARVLLIRHNGCFIIFWRIIDTALCGISSYIYAWIACFGDDAVSSEQ